MAAAFLIIPILAIIILGWLCRVLKYAPDTWCEPLIQFVLKIAAPALLFLVLSVQPMHVIFNWPFILIFGGAAIAFFVIMLLITLIFFKLPLSEAALFGLAAGESSAGFVALPLLLVIFGNYAAVPIAITVFILVVILLPLGILFIELGRQERDKSLFKTISVVVLNTLKTPLILASILGVIYSACHIPMPHLLEMFLHFLAFGAIPCILFALGLDIRIKDIRHNFLAITALGIIKLILLPGAVLGLSLLFHLPPKLAIPAVLVSCVPIAKVVYMMSSKYKIKEEFIAAATTATELASIVTMFCWILLLASIWPHEFTHLSNF